jgi:uncharacterized protein DUF6114
VDDDQPLGAFLVSLTAGILVLIEGVALLAVDGVVSQLGGATAATALLGGIALVGVLFGLVLLAVAILLFVDSDNHTAYGVVLIVAGFLSLFGGGGFLLGALLGVVGGVMAIRFEVVNDDLDFEWEYNRPRIQARAGIPASRPAATQGVCANCRSSVPPGADRCPNCEAPVRPTSFSRSSATGLFGSGEPSPAQPPAPPTED